MPPTVYFAKYANSDTKSSNDVGQCLCNCRNDGGQCLLHDEKLL